MTKKVAQKLRDCCEDCNVIRLNVPTEIYFNDKGELTGFFVDVGKKKLSTYQRGLIYKAVRVVMPWEDEEHLPENKQPVRTRVPKVFRDAFRK